MGIKFFNYILPRLLTGYSCKILTQNSSSDSRWSIPSIFLILLWATSKVVKPGQHSSPSMQVSPFSDRYSCSNVVRASKFSIFVNLLLCKLNRSRFFRLSKFWIFVILFFPRNRVVKFDKPSRFFISRILLSPSSNTTRFFRCEIFSISEILLEDKNSFFRFIRFSKPSIFFIRLNETSRTLRKYEIPSRYFMRFLKKWRSKFNVL